MYSLLRLLFPQPDRPLASKDNRSPLCPDIHFKLSSLQRESPYPHHKNENVNLKMENDHSKSKMGASALP
jgi:hypothetical protein